MPITNYPFIGFFPDAPLRPMVTIRITNPDSGFSVNTYGLIDIDYPAKTFSIRKP